MKKNKRQQFDETTEGFFDTPGEFEDSAGYDDSLDVGGLTEDDYIAFDTPQFSPEQYNQEQYTPDQFSPEQTHSYDDTSSQGSVPQVYEGGDVEDEYADEDEEASSSVVDERLEQIYRRLEEMDKIQSDKMQSAGFAIPFYVPQNAPYYMPPAPAANQANEIIFNELAKLREENLRAQQKNELKEQIDKMREEFEKKLKELGGSSQKDSNPLLSELKKISERITRLEQGNTNGNGSASATAAAAVGQAIKASAPVAALDKSIERKLNLKTEEILDSLRAIKTAIGATDISKDGNIPYEAADRKLAALKDYIAQNNVSLVDKIKKVLEFNDIMCQIPEGARPDLDREFDKIRGVVFGLPVSAALAKELAENFSRDRTVNIDEYFALKQTLIEGDKLSAPSAAVKLLEMKNRLQNGRYQNYNDRLYSDFLAANNDFVLAGAHARPMALQKLKKAADMFASLRAGDLVDIADYRNVRPHEGFISISNKLDEILSIIKSGGQDIVRTESGDEISLSDEIAELKETTVLIGEERHNIILGELEALREAIKELANRAPAEQKAAVADEQSGETPSASYDLDGILIEIARIKELLTQKVEPESDVSAQIAQLKESLDAWTSQQQDLLKENLTSLREEIKALGEYAEEYEQVDEAADDAVDHIASQFESLHNQIDKILAKLSLPSPESQLVEEVRALKEEVFVAKGEIDPEILKEIRTLKEMLNAAKSQDPLGNILLELTRLREEAQKGIVDGDALYGKFEEFKMRLDKFKPMGIAEAAELSVNVVKDTLVEILSEMSSLREDIAESKESQAVLDELAKIKEALPDNSALTAKLDKLASGLAYQEKLENITAKLDELSAKIEKGVAVTGGIDIAALNDSILKSLQSVKSEILEKSAQTQTDITAIAELPVFSEQRKLYNDLSNKLNELKEQIIISKSQSDASLVVESAAIREQINALREALGRERGAAVAQGADVDFAGLKEQIVALREVIRTKELSKGTDVDFAGLLKKQSDELKDYVRAAVRDAIKDAFKDALKDSLTEDKIKQIIRDELSGLKTLSVAAVEHGSEEEEEEQETEEEVEEAVEEEEASEEDVADLEEEVEQIAKITQEKKQPPQAEEKMELSEDDLKLVNQLRMMGLPESSIREILKSGK